jgi:hypothetical protein
MFAPLKEGWKNAPIFERGILRMIYSPIKNSGKWRRYHNELYTYVL